MRTPSMVLLSVAAGVAFAFTGQAGENDNKSAPQAFAPRPLDDDWDWSKWLVGEWEGPVESDVGTAKVWMKIELGLNGQFLIMKSESSQLTEATDEQRQYLRETLHASDEEIERFHSSTFKELQVRTIDPKTGEVVRYLFDGLGCIAKGRARRQGNKEIIEWKWSAHAQGVTSVCIIEKISNNKFTLNHKYNLLHGKRMEDKGELTRKQETAEK